MIIVVAFAFVALAVVAAALACNARFTSALMDGEVRRGQASAVTLITLLITPSVAAVLAGAVIVQLDVMLSPVLLFYAGYAVGLVCFIVLNRRFRRLSGG